MSNPLDIAVSSNERLEQLNRQIKELVGVYREIMVELGHSENEFWIWYTLIMIEGDHTQHDICSLWSLTKQTVNNIVMRMVQEGYVTLETVPGARNRKMIRITESGRDYGTKLIAPISVCEQKAFARLNPNDCMVCMNALNQYISYLKDEFNTTEQF